MSFVDDVVPFLVWIPLVVAWLFALVDILRRVDLSRRARATWFVVVLVGNVVGMFVYYVVRPDPDIGDLAHPRTQERGPGDGFVDELEALSIARDRGELDAAEYQQRKAILLGR